MHPGLLYGKNSLVAELTYKIKGFDTIAAKIKSISWFKNVLQKHNNIYIFWYFSKDCHYCFCWLRSIWEFYIQSTYQSWLFCLVKHLLHLINICNNNKCIYLFSIVRQRLYIKLGSQKFTPYEHHPWYIFSSSNSISQQTPKCSQFVVTLEEWKRINKNIYKKNWRNRSNNKKELVSNNMKVMH